MGIDQGRQQAHEGDQHGACCQERLRVEKIGQHQKEAEKKYHKRITLCA